MTPIKQFISHQGYQIYTKIYGDSKPTIILLHGFPDNSNLYDLLLPELIDSYRIVTFDFLGWGKSEKPKEYEYSSLNQLSELNSVITHFKLENVTLVAHDASGPPAIDWALQNEEKINQLVLLNTYYSNTSSLKAPEAIWLFSTPIVRNIAQYVSKMFNNLIFEKMYNWQVGRFFTNKETREHFVPLLLKQFQFEDSAQHAFFKLNANLRPTFKRASQNLDKLRQFEKPVSIIFGGKDPYLNIGVSDHFKSIFTHAHYHIIDEADHFVQMDAPKETSTFIKMNRAAHA